MKSQKLVSTLAIIVMITLLPILAEYILLTSTIQINDKIGNILIRYQKVITINRLLLGVFYYGLLFMAFKAPSYKKAERKESKGVPKKVQYVMLVISLVCLCTFIRFEVTPFQEYYQFFYPTLLLAYFFTLPMVDFLFIKRKHKGLSLKKGKKKVTDVSINIETINAGYVNVPEPFYHTLIMAGSGSGKSVSCIRPYMKSFVEKGFCGILLDFKSPQLSNEMNTLLRMHGNGKVKYYMVDFTNLRRCHRVNPLAAKYLRNVNYCEEISISLYNNLDKESIKKIQFFERSAVNWMTAIIWFYKKHYPAQCTLPHVLNTVLYHDYKHVISMLLKDPIASDYVRSITTAIEEKAEKQLAGQIASLQNVVTSLNTPELNWILSGSDCNLDLNNPADPKILSIGMDQQMVKALAPCISVILTVALKIMNVEHKHKSFAILDEAHSVFIPDLAHISSVCRSNQLALVIATQDRAQFAEKYGREQMDTILSNMSNRFYGKINHVDTAKVISESIGMEEREMIGKSEGSSQGGKSSASRGQTYSIQEKLIVRTQDIMNLKPGEFVGVTTDSEQNYFWGQFAQTKYNEMNPMQEFVDFVDKRTGEHIDDIDAIIENNYKKIKNEVNAIIQSHPKIY
jgi:hypothetical protein